VVHAGVLLRLESHYLFEHHFCMVRRPMEKGHTETLVGFARRKLSWFPCRSWTISETFNESLADACRRISSAQLRGKKARKAELLEEDASDAAAARPTF